MSKDRDNLEQQIKDGINNLFRDIPFHYMYLSTAEEDSENIAKMLKDLGEIITSPQPLDTHITNALAKRESFKNASDEQLASISYVLGRWRRSNQHLLTKYQDVLLGEGVPSNKFSSPARTADKLMAAVEELNQIKVEQREAKAIPKPLQSKKTQVADTIKEAVNKNVHDVQTPHPKAATSPKKEIDPNQKIMEWVNQIQDTRLKLSSNKDKFIGKQQARDELNNVLTSIHQNRNTKLDETEIKNKLQKALQDFAKASQQDHVNQRFTKKKISDTAAAANEILGKLGWDQVKLEEIKKVDPVEEKLKELESKLKELQTLGTDYINQELGVWYAQKNKLSKTDDEYTNVLNKTQTLIDESRKKLSGILPVNREKLLKEIEKQSKEFDSSFDKIMQGKKGDDRLKELAKQAENLLSASNKIDQLLLNVKQQETLSKTQGQLESYRAATVDDLQNIGVEKLEKAINDEKQQIQTLENQAAEKQKSLQEISKQATQLLNSLEGLKINWLDQEEFERANKNKDGLKIYIEISDAVKKKDITSLQKNIDSVTKQLPIWEKEIEDSKNLWKERVNKALEIAKKENEDIQKTKNAYAITNMPKVIADLEKLLLTDRFRINHTENFRESKLNELTGNIQKLKKNETISLPISQTSHSLHQPSRSTTRATPQREVKPVEKKLTPAK